MGQKRERERTCEREEERKNHLGFGWATFFKTCFLRQEKQLEVQGEANTFSGSRWASPRLVPRAPFCPGNIKIPGNYSNKKERIFSLQIRWFCHWKDLSFGSVLSVCLSLELLLPSDSGFHCRQGQGIKEWKLPFLRNHSDAEVCRGRRWKGSPDLQW